MDYLLLFIVYVTIAMYVVMITSISKMEKREPHMETLLHTNTVYLGLMFMVSLYLIIAGDSYVRYLAVAAMLISVIIMAVAYVIMYRKPL